MAGIPKQYAKQIHVGNDLVVARIKGSVGNELNLYAADGTLISGLDSSYNFIIKTGANLVLTDLVTTDPLATNGSGTVIAGV